MEVIDFVIVKLFIEKIIMPWETAELQVSKSGYLMIVIKGKDGAANAEYGLLDVRTLMRDTSI